MTRTPPPSPVLDPGPDPAEAAAPTAGPAAPATGTAAPATGPRPATYRTGAVHQTLLTLCALGLVVTVIPLTGTARHLFPAAERTQLALLTAPVAGICAIALAV